MCILNEIARVAQIFFFNFLNRKYFFNFAVSGRHVLLDKREGTFVDSRVTFFYRKKSLKIIINIYNNNNNIIKKVKLV